MKLLATSALLLLAACPSRKVHLDEVVATMESFAEQMCGCKDKACANTVDEHMTRWSKEIARKSSRDKALDEQMKRMTTAATKYGECLAKLLAPVEVPPSVDVPPIAKTRDADVLMRSALSWARTTYPQHFPLSIAIYYTDSNALLDDTHGKLYARFGRGVLAADDPTRKTGAPVGPRTTYNDCFGVVWDREHGWVKMAEQCEQAYEAGIHCSVREIWKRGIAGGAPADALATLAITIKPGTRAWGFWITDKPRNIDINRGFEDDCPLAVEK